MFITDGHLRWCSTLTEPCLCKTSGYGVVIALAMATAALEFWGSKESGSLSLLGDAWHVASDTLVYLVAILANITALRSPKKAVLIKKRWALRNANLLIAVALTIIAFAVWRMFHPREILTGIMLIIAVIGLLVNVIMYFLLRAFRIEDEHDHDHLHDTTIWHTLVDTGISVAVVLTGLLMVVFPASILWHIDSFASIAICLVLISLALKTKKVIRKEVRHQHSH